MGRSNGGIGVGVGSGVAVAKGVKLSVVVRGLFWVIVTRPVWLTSKPTRLLLGVGAALTVVVVTGCTPNSTKEAMPTKMTAVASHAAKE